MKRCAIVMMRWGLVLAAIWLAVGPFSRLQAQQDSPLSANFDLPLLTNPAQSGLAGEAYGDYGSNHSLNLNYKEQMKGGFTSHAIRVLSASYNVLLLKRTMSVGLDIYTNTLNNAAVSDFSVHLTYAYHWTVAKGADDRPLHRLSFGLQAGLRNWSVDLQRLKTGGMYDPAYSGGFNPSLVPSFEFDALSRTVLDLQAGVHYTGWVMDNLQVHGGFSAYHLNRSQMGLSDVTVRTPIRFNVYGGVAWRNRELPPPGQKGQFSIDAEQMASEVNGSVRFSNQGDYCVLEIAALYRLYLCGNLSVGAGLAYRTLSKAHVFSPIISLDISRFLLNFQCDLNAGTGNGYTNLFALGLGYRF